MSDPDRYAELLGLPVDRDTFLYVLSRWYDEDKLTLLHSGVSHLNTLLSELPRLCEEDETATLVQVAAIAIEIAYLSEVFADEIFDTIEALD